MQFFHHQFMVDSVEGLLEIKEDSACNRTIVQIVKDVFR